MVDTTALVALVVAGVALVVAAGQLTQQLMATAYVIRKCDRTVTGGLTKGGVRQWHWRQFRFSVKYQAIICTLPSSVYQALGIRPSIQLDTDKPSQQLWNRAIKLRVNRNPMQGSWISFVQDLITCACVSPQSIYLKEESGDRIPDDLTVAPTQVDAITVLLACIAMGMQVYTFSPTSGEFALGGGSGSISASKHPVLGTLLHYSVFSSEPTAGLEVARRHGQALCHKEGIWANTVFGRFRDISYRREFVPLTHLLARKMDVLRASGWEDGPVDFGDTIGGAACFLTFAKVDCYMTVPASVVRRYCVHFAESVVKAHHSELSSHGWNFSKEPSLSGPYYNKIKEFSDSHGGSSPYHSWGSYSDFSTLEEDELLSHLESDKLITFEQLLLDLRADFSLSQSSNRWDPSSYVSTAAAWDVILWADHCTSYIAQRKYGSLLIHPIVGVVETIIATATSSLQSVGPPSWGRAAEQIKRWPQTFSTACEAVLGSLSLPPDDRKWVSIYARLSILRAAYYTIMMRAAGEVGTGLTEQTKIETALVYMA
jgi:hypothetical protein